MRTSVEMLEGNKVKLSVEVDESEFERALDAAFRKLGSQIRVPGFRPGKVPRRLVEARIGTDIARQEALRDALPDFYERALKEHDVQPVSPPEIDITSGRETGPVAFDAVVEVMPQVRIGGYEGLRVVLPSLEISDAEVDAQVDRLREQFGELRPVARTARDGDHVSMDRRVTRHDETLLAADDELYEIGKGSVAPELDENLRGARAGDILKFNATVPDHGEVTFQILVKEVREKVLPEVTDEWASEASEYDTVAELREDMRRRLDAVRRLEAALAVRDKVLEALVELVDEDMPSALVETELNRRLESLSHRLAHQGADVDEYLRATGRSLADLEADLRQQAIDALKADLALQAVADAEGITVTEADVEAEIERIAERRNESAEATRRVLQSEGQLSAVRSGIRRSKALEWLIAHTEYVDENGQVIDRSKLEPSPAATQEPAETAGTDQESSE